MLMPLYKYFAIVIFAGPSAKKRKLLRNIINKC